jgi:hypothetical protein
MASFTPAGVVLLPFRVSLTKPKNVSAVKIVGLALSVPAARRSCACDGKN